MSSLYSNRSKPYRLLLFLFFIFIVCLLVLSTDASVAQCKRRTYFHDSFVCVCNNSYCDEIEPLGLKSNSSVVVIYTTSLMRNRLDRKEAAFQQSTREPSSDQFRLVVDANTKFQKILGFGGGITDATMYIFNEVLQNNFKTLAEHLFNQYFGSKGISYNMGRVPIASCDFSVTNYSYLDKRDDFELKSFALSKFEFYRWEFLARAQNESDLPLRLVASPWSAPAWIKTNNQMQGGGKIFDTVSNRFYLLYAKYFIRFFEEYAKRGVRFWATTVQNEPFMTYKIPWQSMEFDTETQKEFVQKRLGPMMRKNWATKDLKIIVHDDLRYNLLSEAYKYYSDNDSFIDGMAFHWYYKDSYDQIRSTYQFRPDKILLSTEACNAFDFELAPQLGYWEYAQNYASDIIKTLLNYAGGWIDWNIWLNVQGGPNWMGNFVDAPIIVNVTAGEFYKQPTYYIMGHFSKFILPDSVRIDSHVDKFNDQLETIAFLLPDGKISVVLLNKSNTKAFNISLSMKDSLNSRLEILLDAKSIKTVVWKPMKP